MSERVENIKANGQFSLKYLRELEEKNRIKREATEEGLKEGREKGLKEGIKEGREKGREEGLKEGREEGRKESARKMKDLGYDVDVICEITGLPKEEIEALQSQCV